MALTKPSFDEEGFFYSICEHPVIIETESSVSHDTKIDDIFEIES